MSLLTSRAHPRTLSPSISISLPHYKTKKKRERKLSKRKKTNKQDILHSLRVTLIFDCICCIRGWPACHTRYDSSICQLRCISVSHYLTETYLIGSMKVLMGLKRNSKHDLVNGNSQVQGLKKKLKCVCCSFFFLLVFSILFFPVSSLSSFSTSPAPLLHLCFCLSSASASVVSS